MFKKIKKFFKGILATTLSATTTVSGVAAVATQNVSAANEWVLSTKLVYAAFHFGSDSARYQYWHNQTSLFTLTNTNTGEVRHVFCLEPGVDTTDGNTYSNADTIMADWADNNVRLANLAGIYYLYNGSGKLGSSYNEYLRTAVQWYIWKLALWEGEGNANGVKQPGEDLNWTQMEAKSGNASVYAAVKAEYDKMSSWINTIHQELSFVCTNNCDKDAQGNYTLNPGESVVLVDINGVFQDATYSTPQSPVNGLSFNKNGNTLTVTASNDFSGSFNGEVIAAQQFMAIHQADEGAKQFAVFSNGNIQTLLAPYGVIDPYDYPIKVKITSGKITVEKYDSIYGDALANTIFEVYDAGNNKVATIKTDSEGKASTDWLPYGNYTVKEVTPSKGYNNDNAAGKSVTLDSENAIVQFTDKIIQGTASVTKIDVDTKEKLKDAVFEVYKTAGVSGVSYPNPIKVETVTTAENGYALTGILDYGEYYFIEKTAPVGYNNGQVKYTFKIEEENVNVSVTATNKIIRGTSTITKTDVDTGRLLKNATFDIYKTAGVTGEKYTTPIKVETVTTGEDGTIKSGLLDYGDYYFVETKAPTGYNKSNTQYSFEIREEGKDVPVAATNKVIRGTVSVTKTDIDTGKKLKEASFDIYKTAGVEGVELSPKKVGTITTDENGYAKSDLLDYGDYYLVESKAAYGYYNPEIQYPFEIREEGVNVPISATNARQTLQINVTKLDNNSDSFGLDDAGNKLKLEGATFELYEHVIRRDDINTDIILSESESKIATATTDKNGVATFNLQTSYSSSLQYDSYYYVKEVGAPKGYILDESNSQKFIYEYGNQYDPKVIIDMTFENEIMKAPITVTKTDVETKETLEGAKFEIYNSKNQLVDTIVTNKDGEATSKDLRPGKYSVKEVEAPNNYQLTNILDFNNNTNGTITKEVEITIEETDTAGEYKAVGASTEFTNLHNKGKLTVTKVDGMTVDYKEECDANGENCVSVPVLKSDSVLLPNVEFVIYDKNDLSKAVATGTTDETGSFSVILNTGEYYLQETKAPEGYNINPSLMEIKLNTHGEEVERIITNMTVYGQISVYKVGEKLIGVEVDPETGITNLVYENTYYSDVEFELYSNEDIYHPLTKKLIYEKDELVRKIKTGSDGKVTVTDLPLGEYYVKEITAPEGHSVYDATSDIKYISLTAEDANFEGLIEDDLTFVNERITVDPQLYKVGAKLVEDSDTETKYEYTPLPGAIFGVYNQEEITYTDKSDKEQTIAADTLLGTMETNKEGFADVEIKIPFGKYYVKEIQAPEGYHLNEDKFEFELVWSQELQENNLLVVEVVDAENPIINYEIIIPSTGVNTMLYSGIGIATIAIAGASIIITKKRKIEE